MSDISNLEQRITAALDRIRQGLNDGIASQAGQVADSALEDALAEKAALQNQLDAQRDEMQKLDAELQKLRVLNVTLRDMNTKLREAVTTGLAPDLLDSAVAAEIASLHAQRSADAAEIDAIIAELKPLVTGA